MNLDVRAFVAPAIAVALFVLIGVQTSDALKRSGAWSARGHAPKATADPYAGLDAQLARRDPGIAPIGVRDPFAYGSAPVPVRTTVAPRPYVPPPPARPVLTAIVWDATPTALIRFEDRNFSVKAGDLFAAYRVVSIAQDEVVLDSGGQRLVLKRPLKGD
jgi:hypothetical protein